MRRTTSARRWAPLWRAIWLCSAVACLAALALLAVRALMDGAYAVRCALVRDSVLERTVEGCGHGD